MMEGVPLSIISKYAGHKDIETTHKIYCHSDLQLIKANNPLTKYYERMKKK